MTDLHDISKVASRIIITNIGLRTKYEKILFLYYIEEKSHYEIADELNITRQSAINLLSKAKKELKKIIDKEYHLIDSSIKPYVDLLLEK